MCGLIEGGLLGADVQRCLVGFPRSYAFIVSTTYVGYVVVASVAYILSWLFRQALVIA